MKLWSILGNSQKLDGGAMFGNVPRAMWASRAFAACVESQAAPASASTGMSRPVRGTRDGSRGPHA